MNIITGEKIQNICDYYIGTLFDFEYNPYIKNQKNKQINIDNNNIIMNNIIVNNIFCYTHILANKFDLLYL